MWAELFEGRGYIVVWKWVVEHPIEAVIALLLAWVAALSIEFLKTTWRSLRNMIDPKTVAEIDKRIKEHLEFRRIITNDKALYLAMFRTVLGVLFMLAIGAATFVLGDLEPDSRAVTGTKVASLAIFGLTSFICSVSMKTAFLDSKEKLDSRVAEIDSKIAKLRARRADLIPKQAGGPSLTIPK
jgi:hypothetical protein